MFLLLACLPRTSSECTRPDGCPSDSVATFDSPVTSDSHPPTDYVAELVGKGRTFDSIQDAIVDAADGDVVLVQPGTHHERLGFHGKDIIVRSAAGPSATVLDGDREGPVVSARAMEPATAMREGFTIINGTGVAPDGFEPGTPHGGGIYIENADLVIRHNVIQGNQAAIGGGIYLRHGEAVVENNLILENFAAQGGGGVTCTNCQGVIRYDTFVENTAQAGPLGEWFYEPQGDFIGNVVVLEDGEPFAIRFMQALGYTFAIEHNLLAPVDVPWIDPMNFERDEFPEDLDTIREVPVFEDGFHLAAGSPGVDQGPEDELDPDGSRADVGAHGGPHGDWSAPFE
ncbi:MAG: hypothetical protein GY913_11550 [Proteobacteria bacterium]|nr:hypothetical protein [Pseudomonadota bacterium]MCP4917549.1 hypothetical protein [Pseudomonadota bacterium]